MKIEFKNHPAAAQHPVTGIALVNDDGSHVPLIKDQHSVYIDGYMVGYTKADGSWLMTTIHLQPPVLEAVRAAMAEKYGQQPKDVRQALEPDEQVGEEPAGNETNE